jgi:hypothetical protein
MSVTKYIISVDLFYAENVHGYALFLPFIAFVSISGAFL